MTPTPQRHISEEQNLWLCWSIAGPISIYRRKLNNNCGSIRQMGLRWVVSETGTSEGGSKRSTNLCCNDDYSVRSSNLNICHVDKS